MRFTRTPTSKKRILGIDPGVATTGFGVIDMHGAENLWVHHGIITTEKISFSERLLQIQKEIYKLCDRFNPDLCGVEEIFFAKNTKTAMQVAHARGVILVSLRHKGIPCMEFSPRQTKLALTGYGQADKKQMQMMTRAILHLPEIPKPDDAADALAAALCAAQHMSTFELQQL